MNRKTPNTPTCNQRWQENILICAHLEIILHSFLYTHIPSSFQAVLCLVFGRGACTCLFVLRLILFQHKTYQAERPEVSQGQFLSLDYCSLFTFFYILLPFLSYYYNHKVKNSLKCWQSHVLINISEQKLICTEIIHSFCLHLPSYISVPVFTNSESLEFILNINKILLTCYSHNIISMSLRAVLLLSVNKTAGQTF